MTISRLNHAVLYVTDAVESSKFYQEIFEFEVVTELPGAVFLKCKNSKNDHDLGLFTLGEKGAIAQSGAKVGLYHLAWQVETLGELKVMQEKLLEHSSLAGSSDHGQSKSLYGKDSDGIEFEIMWAVPQELMGPDDDIKIARLNLEQEIARFGENTRGRNLNI